MYERRLLSLVKSPISSSLQIWQHYSLQYEQTHDVIKTWMLGEDRYIKVVSCKRDGV